MVSAEEEFRNQVDLMTHSVDSLFPQPFLSLLNGHMNKVAIVAQMGVIHGLKDMDFHAPKLTWIQLLLSVTSANSRDPH